MVSGPSTLRHAASCSKRRQNGVSRRVLITHVSAESAGRKDAKQSSLAHLIRRSDSTRNPGAGIFHGGNIGFKGAAALPVTFRTEAFLPRSLLAPRFGQLGSYNGKTKLVYFRLARRGHQKSSEA